MPNNTELLTRCAEKLGRAELRNDQLTEENQRLLGQFAEPSVLERENHQLWLALAQITCDCAPLAESICAAIGS